MEACCIELRTRWWKMLYTSQMVGIKGSLKGSPTFLSNGMFTLHAWAIYSARNMPSRWLKIKVPSNRFDTAFGEVNAADNEASIVCDLRGDAPRWRSFSPLPIRRVAFERPTEGSAAEVTRLDDVVVHSPNLPSRFPWKNQSKHDSAYFHVKIK